MVWLATKMWLLLLLAFLLGTVSGWFIFWRNRDDLAYAKGDHGEADERDLKLPNASVSDDVAVQESKLVAENTADAEPEAERTVREYGKVTPTRQKIYERDIDDSDPDSFLNMPDLDKSGTVNSTKDQSTNLDDVRTFASNNMNEKLGSAPQLYSTPVRGAADDLKLISGIGPTLERTLNAKGIYYYNQIAAWTDDHVTWIERDIDFPGRVRRENWVGQAVELAKKAVVKKPDLKKPEVSTQTTKGAVKAPEIVAPKVEPNTVAVETQKPARVGPEKPKPEQPIMPQAPVTPTTTVAVTPPISASGPTPVVDPELPMSALDRLIANKKLAKR